MPTKPIALVTGANTGIGFEIARQLAEKGLTVLLGSRDPAKGLEAINRLEKRPALDIHQITLDQTGPDTIEQAVRQINQQFGRLDVLVNNAAILVDQGAKPSDLNPEKLRQTLE